MSNPPIKRYKIGSIELSIWENEVEGKNGKFTAMTGKLKKNYKDGDQWKSTDNIKLTEFADVAQLFLKANEDLRLKNPDVNSSAKE